MFHVSFLTVMTPTLCATTRRVFSCLLFAWMTLCASTAQAGLLLESTRIVYPASAPARTLTLSNTNDWPVVVQAWFDHGEGDPQALQPPFIVLPAVFRLNPGEAHTLRILPTGEPLPETQESVYWLNLYEVPPAALDADMDSDAARLDLALNTQLKLFYRPDGLDALGDIGAHLAEELRFSLKAEDGYWFIVCHNPTAWHASFAGLAVENTGGGTQPLVAIQEPDMMTAPYSERRYRLPPGQPRLDAPVQFTLIDDAGFGHTYQAKTYGTARHHSA